MMGGGIAHPAEPAVFSRAEQPSRPFPTTSFIAVGTVWVLVDLEVVGALAIALYSGGRPPFLLMTPWGEALFIAWQASLAAKAMLLLGWWFLGEGQLGHRLAGVF